MRRGCMTSYLWAERRNQSKKNKQLLKAVRGFLHSKARHISMASQARAPIWQPWQRLETRRTLIFNDRANDRHTALRQPIRAEMPTGKKREKEREKGEM